MLSTIKITSALFPELYDSILRGWNANLSREQWHRPFNPRWASADDSLGYALADGSRIVGMMGMLFSERSVAGRRVPFCNLHSWYVSPEHRAHSLALLKPVLTLKDHVVTDFTPGPAVSAISQRLGFLPLESDVLLLPPMPPSFRQSEAEVTELRGADDAQAAGMAPADRQIYQDHLEIDCGHLLVRHGGRYCYLVYSRVAAGGVPHCVVHHASDVGLFAQHQAAIRKQLLRGARARFAVIETRHLKGARIPWSLRASAKEKLYRGEGVAAHEIDTLYSEMVLLKHPVMPSLAERLRTTVKHCIPPAIRAYAGIGERGPIRSAPASRETI